MKPSWGIIKHLMKWNCHIHWLKNSEIQLNFLGSTSNIISRRLQKKLYINTLELLIVVVSSIQTNTNKRRSFLSVYITSTKLVKISNRTQKIDIWSQLWSHHCLRVVVGSILHKLTWKIFQRENPKTSQIIPSINLKTFSIESSFHQNPKTFDVIIPSIWRSFH
jgi:hypothetical protein